MSDVPPSPSQSQPPRWQPLAALDRRVLGVLVEKAKTTPDIYPMSINAIKTGCNQRNNRSPLMEVEIEDIEESLDRLRGLKAIAEVQGGSRVARYRHLLYEWLGVDKVELAVMAELLLRGAQTEGELRGRAARMEPIADVSALRPVLASLESKRLVISLTPAGRGHMVSHALYEPREMEKVRAEAAHAAHDSTSSAPSSAHAVATQPPPQTASPVRAQSRAQSESYAKTETVDALRRELEEMRTEMAQLRKDLDDLWSNFR